MKEQLFPIRLKIPLLGGPGSGKAALIHREVQDKFIPDFPPTLGLDLKTKQYNLPRTVRVQLWVATGGQRFIDMLGYAKNSHAICLCFSLNESDAIERLSKWLKKIEEHEIECPLYLLGCKCDLQQAVPQEEIIEFAKKNKMKFFRTSSKESIGVNSAFKAIVKQIESGLCERPELLQKAMMQPQSCHCPCSCRPS